MQIALNQSLTSWEVALCLGGSRTLVRLVAGADAGATDAGGLGKPVAFELPDLSRVIPKEGSGKS